MLVDIIEQYKQAFFSSQGRLISPKNAELNTLRATALESMSSLNFPTRKTEDWKYTLVPDLKKTCFPLAQPPQGSTRLQEPSVISNVDRYQIMIHNGHYDKNRSVLPQSIHVESLVSALESHPELITLIESQVHSHHVFSLLNTAFLNGGVYIRVPDNVILDKPIHLIYHTTESDVSYYTKNFIFLGDNSRAQLIEEYVSENALPYFNNMMMRIELNSGSSLSHCKIIQEGASAQHIALSQIIVRDKAEYHSDLLALSGSMMRSDLDVSLDGSHAKCYLNGLVLGDAEQHIDTHTRIAHHVPSCQSQQLYKGIYSDHATGVFNGKVFVARDAQHTDSSQMNKNLLLSPTAEVNTKPELEIYADDVKCAHGATIGQLDQNALFFLRSRGISQAEATILLIHAFAKDVVDNLCISEISTSIQKVIDRKLSTF